jgi:hypothetical protein
VHRRRGRDHVANVCAQIGPVGERESRQQAALADREERDLATPLSVLAADRVNEVLDRDLDVGRLEVRKVDVADRVTGGVERALAQRVGLLAACARASHEQHRLAHRVP